MIEFKNVIKTRGTHVVLSNASARFEPGETVAIFGTSGSGKSALMSLMIAADSPTSGTVEVDGVDLKKVPAPIMKMLRRRIGVMFSDLKLLADRSVAENVGFTLEVCGVPDTEINTRVAELLAKVNLSDAAEKLPGELTRAEQVRVALARAVANKPLILLVDDPFRALDRHEVAPFIRLLRSMKNEDMTLLCTTSDAEIAAQIGGRTLQIRNGSLTPLAVAAAEQMKEAELPMGRQSRSEHKVTPVKQAMHKEEIPLGVLKDRSAKQQVKVPGAARKIKVTAIGS